MLPPDNQLLDPVSREAVPNPRQVAYGAVHLHRTSVAALPVELLARLVDRAADCLQLVDANGIVRYTNSRGLADLDLLHRDDGEHRSWYDLWSHETRADCERALTLAMGGTATRFQACRLARDQVRRWWDVSVTPLTGDCNFLVLATLRDITEFEIARQHFATYMEEMSHRLKNSYAVVSSLMRQHASGNTELEVFANEMGARISTMACAQSMIASHGETSLKICDLVSELLEPFRMPACPISVECNTGDAVSAAKAKVLALIIGELAVNSIKHGTIGRQGTLHIVVDKQGNNLGISWLERGSYPVSRNESSKGKGIGLMQRILKLHGGDLSYVWQADGLDVEIRLSI